MSSATAPGGTRSEAGETPAGHWAMTAAISALLIASLLPLGAVIQGTGWWVTAVVAIASVVVPSAIVRALGRPSWLGPLVGGAVWLLSLVVFYAPQSAVFGVVPTPETLSAFQVLSVEAGQSLYVQSVPVEPITPLLFLLAVGLGAVAVLADVVGISLRSPALTGVLAVAMLVPPSIFTGNVDLVAYVVVAVAYLVVLRVDGRRAGARGLRASSRSAALGVGAAAVAVTVIAATFVPTFSAGSLVEPDGDSAFGSGVSELADLGRDLQRPGNTPHFTYQTTSTSAQYLRMLTLDQFEGTRWTSSGDHGVAEQSDDERLNVPGLVEGTVADEATVNVQITGLVGDLLPMPFPSVAVSGLEGRWEWDTEGLTVSSPTASVEGQEYSVTSLVLQPTAEQLRSAAPDYPGEVAPFLDLPDDIPDALQSVFDDVTAGTTSGYDAAYAIQQYLRTEFSYSVSTPVEDGYDGDGLEAIAEFLEAGSGYCVHFASAMAILTRMAGIPSRVSLGYLPGDRVGSETDGYVAYRVGSDDLHAWPELYFAGIGWVPFEPTPGRGIVPSYALEPGTAPDPEDIPEPAATQTPSATPAPTATTAPDSGASGDDGATRATQTTAVGSVLLVLVLAVLLTPAGVRLTRRRRRFTSAAERGSVAPVWDDLVDSAADLGHSVGDADSERDLAGRLRRVLWDAAEADAASRSGGRPSAEPLVVPAASALDRLLAAVESERYSGSTRSGAERVATARRDLADVVSALGAASTRAWRVRAMVAPLSVLSPRAGAVGRAIPAALDVPGSPRG